MLGDVEQAPGAAGLADLPDRAALAALAPLRVEVGGRAEPVARVAAHVDVVLAALGLRADAEVLDRAADHADGVPLEVRERDQHVGRGDAGGDVRFLENEALG